LKTRPIQPARIEFGTAAADPPRAPDFDATYRPHKGALAHARHVFLHGSGLPGRWAGRDDFTVLEAGFGLGHNFLALWDAWRQDPQRCERLHVVSVELHPPSLDDLRRVHAKSALPELTAQLLTAWPPLTPNLHQLAFEGGRLRLMLVLGDAGLLLPALRLQANAIFLDGFAPARNPTMWSRSLLKAVGRLSAPDATAATWNVASDLHQHLATAGFQARIEPSLDGKDEITCAPLVPRPTERRLPTLAVASADAVVVGAGLAGAAAARALADRGLRVTVLEKAVDVATGASGTPAGLFHGTVNPGDGPYARLYRTAALVAQQRYREAVAAGVPGRVDGLLRLAPHKPGEPEPLALLRATGLAPSYVRWLDAVSASARAGVTIDDPCWFYPGGGWITPAAWVEYAMAHPRITVRTGCEVAALTRSGPQWQCLDARGAALAQSALLVLAHAEGVDAILRPLGHVGWPLGRSRGQISFWRTDAARALQLPVAGDGYAIATSGGLLCGATRQLDDEEPGLRDEDHRYNIDRLQRLSGLPGPAAGVALQGRVGWRLAANDRLPVVGAMPLLGHALKVTQTRLLPRERGLFVLTALGARGLTLAPLMGELVASQATGTPWPLEQDLADAVDPGRWLVRQARLLT
jgi:tRNA 5-methylaminomethyl-2-thiouridine biosynthesis bifunctional protein